MCVKPCKFSRVTYRDVYTKPDEWKGWQVDFSHVENWTKTLTAKHIEDHLERKHSTGESSTMLISLHGITDGQSLDRAFRYATTQQDRLFFDRTYEDPNVWMTLLDTAKLEWTCIEMQGQNVGKSIRALHGHGCYFFSTEEARRVFGGLQSRYATIDEWFAVGKIAPDMPMHHYQLAHGVLYKHPYRLIPTPISLANLINLGDGDFIANGMQRRAMMTEKEKAEELALAQRMEEEGTRRHISPAENLLYVRRTRMTKSGREQSVFGIVAQCVAMSEDLRVIVPPSLRGVDHEYWCQSNSILGQISRPA